MKKKIFICLSLDLLLIILYALLVDLQVYLKINHNISSTPIINIFLSNLEFYAVPTFACTYFLILIFLLRDITEFQPHLLIIGNSLILFLIGVIVNQLFMSFDHFSFIQFVLLTICLHIILSFCFRIFNRNYYANLNK